MKQLTNDTYFNPVTRPIGKPITAPNKSFPQILLFDAWLLAAEASVIGCPVGGGTLVDLGEGVGFGEVLLIDSVYKGYKNI